MNMKKLFFQLMINSVSEKTLENGRNHRDIKPATPAKWRKRLVLEPNYHSCKNFSDHLMAKEIKRTRAKINKLLYLAMSTSDIIKMLLYNFWYDYFKQKYGDRAKITLYGYS